MMSFITDYRTYIKYASFPKRLSSQQLLFVIDQGQDAASLQLLFVADQGQDAASGCDPRLDGALPGTQAGVLPALELAGCICKGSQTVMDSFRLPA